MDSPVALVGGALGVLLIVGLALVLSLRTRRPKAAATRPEWSADASLADGHRPPDVGGLSSQLLAVARQVLGATGAAVLVPGEDGWRVSLVSPGLMASFSRALPLREGLLGLAYDGEKEIVADPVQPEALGYLPGQDAPLGVALLPIVHRGKTRALLACHRPSGRPFSKEDMGLLRRCATLLEGWETYAADAADLSHRMDQSERLFSGLSAMLQERESARLCELMLDALFDFVPAVMGFVLIQQPKYDARTITAKPADLPLDLQQLGEHTWTYRVLAKDQKPLYLEGDASLATGMPFLCDGEPFPAGGTVYLSPLATAEPVFGVVGLMGKAGVRFLDYQRRLVDRFLSQAAALVELALMKEFEEANAVHDGLTRLHNRRYFDERLVKEMKRSHRDGAPLSLLILDVDRFKRVNDTHGHMAGDLVLQALARAVEASVRDMDVVCRFGGEEFSAILPNCPPEEARQAAERIRRAVEAIPTAAIGLAAPVTVSIGAATFPQPFSSLTGLLRGADEALYAAKTKGRNRVEVAGRQS